MSLNNKNLLPANCYQLPIRQGFTLIEVLVSIVILVVVIGGIVALESGNIKTGNSSKYSLQANGLGQQTFNAVKSLGDRIKVGGSEGAYTCKDPNDPTKCSSGVYYLDGGELKSCNNCRNMTNSTDIACPTDGSTLRTDNIVCIDASAINLNNKDFKSTVIFP